MVYVLQVVHGDSGGVFDVGCEVHVPVKDDTKVSSCVATRNDMAINQDAVNGVVAMLTLGVQQEDDCLVAIELKFVCDHPFLNFGNTRFCTSNCSVCVRGDKWQI